jgi:hypothetical protein
MPSDKEEDQNAEEASQAGISVLSKTRHWRNVRRDKAVIG